MAAPKKARGLPRRTRPFPSTSKDTNEKRCDLTILWRIENISLLEIKDNWSWRTVKSPHFATRTLEGVRFRLVLHTMVQRRDDAYLLVKLVSDRHPFGVPRKCELSLMDSKGSPLVSTDLICPDIQKYRSLVLLDGIKHDEVFVTRKSEFLPLDTLTIRFRLWKKHLMEEFISARSQIEIAQNSFLWPIPGFSSLQLHEGVTTPVRLGFTNVSNNFLLKFSLKGARIEDAGAHVELIKVSVPIASLASLKVSVLDNEHKVIKCMNKKSEVTEADSPGSLILSDLVSRKELLRENSCLKNDVLHLLCEVPSVQRTNYIEKHCYGIAILKEHISEQDFKCLDTKCPISIPIADPLHFFKRSNFLV